ncbi:hypothetical protein [Amycolatopsis circi]|uniref:hypothetical protein n=1 Tax=Amycolatopsis circi TaxID=871959 RepID=UPI001FCA14E9|nr:hypothetical protein [Amycolatopsis circi]
MEIFESQVCAHLAGFLRAGQRLAERSQMPSGDLGREGVSVDQRQDPAATPLSSTISSARRGSGSASTRLRIGSACSAK